MSTDYAAPLLPLDLQALDFHPVPLQLRPDAYLPITRCEVAVIAPDSYLVRFDGDWGPDIAYKPAGSRWLTSEDALNSFAVSGALTAHLGDWRRFLTDWKNSK